jgi:asparagine synthase (glutamine-hydrolysing)
MCGIAGVFNFNFDSIPYLDAHLKVMNDILAHRGPDDFGIWTSKKQPIGLSHNRLSIVDLSNHAHQPMIGPNGHVVVFNGEIYNHVELREELKSSWDFYSQSDTEVILAAYAKFGVECVKKFKGMFAFAIWDGERLFCARDHFGIKPFYYSVQNKTFYFASEAKALLPFIPEIKTKRQAFAEYVTFQYPMGDKTLFEHINQLEPAHAMVINKDGLHIWRYWDVHYHLDFDHTAHYFEQKLEELLDESIRLHLRADVEVGAYVSGGIDSSLIGVLASREKNRALPFFHGRFLEGKSYDESDYAKLVAVQTQSKLHICDITENDFINHLDNIIYHMDFPVAGPGVFPQYMVSEMARNQGVKVVLGGQGGDELFGGYARYLVAYFEQVIKAEIEGTSKNHSSYVVTAESIIPNLESLKAYKPMLKQFWSKGLFDSLDKRYFNLIDRGADLAGEIELSPSERAHCFQIFSEVFNFPKFEKAESYFNGMTHFDLKCLLPGLLHVEDRVSMAHGLESRVPLLYWPLVEFVSTIPATIKFSEGRMKHLLKTTFAKHLPQQILHRKDKMGFPVPLTEWMQGNLKDYIFDILKSGSQRPDNFMNYNKILENYHQIDVFSRKMWGLVCYEIWQQQFHDKAVSYQKMRNFQNIELIS